MRFCDLYDHDDVILCNKLTPVLISPQVDYDYDLPMPSTL